MLRRIHSVPGLIAAVLVSVLALTGVILSINPALERARSSIPPAGEISVVVRPGVHGLSAMPGRHSHVVDAGALAEPADSAAHAARMRDAARRRARRGPCMALSSRGRGR